MLKSSHHSSPHASHWLALSSIALLLTISAPSRAEDSTLKQDAKTVGQQTGDAVHKIGETGKEVGKKVVETAREVGHATRDGVKEFGKAVKGEAHSASSQTQKAAAKTEAKQSDATVANK